MFCLIRTYVILFSVNVPPPMSTNLNAKVVAQVEKQVDAMLISNPTAATSQQASKNRKKK